MADKSLRDRLIGAWSLVSYEERPVDGSPSFYPMGTSPKDIIMYTSDGFMSAQLSKPDRKPFRSGDTQSGANRPGGESRRDGLWPGYRDNAAVHRASARRAWAGGLTNIA